MNCPACGQFVPDTAFVCGHCGRRLRDTSPLHSPSHPVDLNAPVLRDQRQHRRRSPIAKLLLLLALLAIVGTGGALAAYYLGYIPTLAPRTAALPPAALPTAASLPTIQNEATGPQPVVVLEEAAETPLGQAEDVPIIPALPAGAPDLLLDAQSLAYDPFDTLDLFRWNDPLDKAVVVNGTAILAASDPAEANPWAWFGDQRRYATGEAALLRMKFDQGTDFEVHMSSGDWDTAGYARWGLYKLSAEAAPQINAWSGTEKIDANQPFQGNLEMAPHRWYYWLLAADGSSGVQVIWDPEQPGASWEAQVPYQAGWEVVDWRLNIQVFQGILHVDECYSLRFAH